MYCANCHNHLDTKRTGFVVCPHCRHVNIASGIPQFEKYIAQLLLPEDPHYTQPQPATPAPSQKTKAPDQPKALRKKLTKNARQAATNLAISLVVAVALFAVTQNIVARYRVTHAAHLDATGQYSQASSMLADVPSALVLPGTHHSQQAQAAQTKQWLTYLRYQNDAQKLINAKQYDQALALLQKIPRDYPTYQTVSASMQFIKSARDTANPTAATATPSLITTNSLCRVDATAAPDLLDVAKKAAAVCKKEFPHIESLLSPTIYPAPHPVTFTNSAAYAGETIGSGVSLSAPYFRTQPADMGAVVHELAHVVQAYPNGPSWITEGIADYVRYQLGYTEPWSGWFCGDGARYTDGYGCAATMLRFASNHYDKNIVKEIHAAMRAGTYTNDLFVAKTGKTSDQV